MSLMTQPLPFDLSSDIKAERAGIEALVEVLRAEREALKCGETDRVAAMAPRKRELLLHIAHLGDQRTRLLTRCGTTPDRLGMERLLASLPPTDPTRDEWSALIELTQRAHRLNQENGAFIDAGMRATHQALSCLRSAANASSTYSSAGRAVSAVNSRTYASA